MLAQARGYDALHEADIATWHPETPPALIFSNAALQWLPDHARLMPRLAGLLAPGGVLAVQMPGQGAAPSHMLLHQVAARLFPDRFSPDPPPAPVAPPGEYWAMLAPLGAVSVWETTYLQALPADAAAHPVRRFTESTAMRPIVARLTPEEVATYLAAYDAALAGAYPPLADGRALMPFRRLFFTLVKG